MIVDSMTYQEIAAEVKKDYHSYIEFRKDMAFGMLSKYRRYMLKEAKDNQQVFFKPINFTTPSGNTYVIQYNSKGRSDYKRNPLLFIPYMYFYRPDGIYAVMITGDKFDCFSFYTPHLFDRYRERELKDINKPKLQTILDFFRNNATTTFQSVDNAKYENSIFNVSPKGVLLGSQLSEYIYEYRTYITFDMLRGEQIDRKDKLQDAVKYYIDNVQ